LFSFELCKGARFLSCESAAVLNSGRCCAGAYVSLVSVGAQRRVPALPASGGNTGLFSDAHADLLLRALGKSAQAELGALVFTQ